MVFAVFCMLQVGGQGFVTPVPGVCDVNVIVAYEARLEDLNRDDVLAFLQLTDVSCFSNVEFLEYFNEVLFLITEHHGQWVLEHLSALESMNRKIILSELASPINDGVDLDSLRAKFSVEEAPLICRALDVAIAQVAPTTPSGPCFQPLLSPGAGVAETLVCSGQDFNSDGIADKVTFMRDTGAGQCAVRFSISRPDASPASVVLRRLDSDDLGWVAEVGLLHEGSWLIPTLVDAATGDILGSDVEAGVLLKSPAVIMTPAERDGALVVYFKAGKLIHLYL